MPIRFHALPAETVAALRAGGPDAYGAPAERAVSDGNGNPCRCCLTDIAEGADMLIAAHRPFPDLQPYAETGPIFLCADCERREASGEAPPSVAQRPEFLVKAYTQAHRIHSPGDVRRTASLAAECEALLANPEIAYVDLRSAANNCFICRVERG